MATSPVVLFHIVQPMSDIAATAWCTLAIACAISTGRVSACVAGLAAGAVILVRPNLAPLAGAVAVLTMGWLRSDAIERFTFDRLSLFLAFAACGAGALATLQWRMYGTPLTTGYGDISEFFAVSNIAPNVRDYAWRLVRGEGPVLVLGACALAGLVTGRSSTASVKQPAVVTALIGGIVLALYLPYGVFPDWSYLRFLLPALPLVFVLTGALAASAAERVPAPARGLVLLLAITIVCALDIVRAGREGAFQLRDFEARYRTMGLYLEAALPKNAVVITSQESGSVRHYTGLPIVRWDLLNVEVDAASATLRAHGKHPVLVVEDWEVPVLRARWPESPIARVDWRPRADVGETTHVWLWDPDDRDREDRYATDRLR